MKTLKERLSELEKELTPVCKAHEDDCDKCPYKCTKCREYIELAADFYGIGIFGKVDFEHVQGDVFEICIA